MAASIPFWLLEVFTEALRRLEMPFHWAIDACHALVAQWGTSEVRARVVASPLVQAMYNAFSGRNAESPPGIFFALICLVLSLAFFGKGYFVKAKLWIYASVYFCASRDKRAFKPSEWRVDINENPRKKIIFIRNGESEWNVVFKDRCGMSFFCKLLCALAKEAALFVQADSVFIDSPLTMKGVEQSQDLLRFLAATNPEKGCDALCREHHGDNEVCLVCGKFASLHKGDHKCEKGDGGGRASFPGRDYASKSVADLSVAEIVTVMRGDTARSVDEGEQDGGLPDPGRSIVVSSTLRRAISTVLMCLITRLLRQPQRKVVLMTALQEVSRSMDTLALAPAGASPRAPLAETARKDAGDVVSLAYETLLDPSLNKGNKSPNSCCQERQNEFCKWVFEQKEDWIIVCGHAVWFREFFRSFLPKRTTSSRHGLEHEFKARLIPPCGVVAFDLYKGEQNMNLCIYRVQPESIKQVYPARDGAS